MRRTTWEDNVSDHHVGVVGAQGLAQAPRRTGTAVITDHEREQVNEANASGRTPVVFVHGLWLLPSSWDRWQTVFDDAGYTTLAPGWPDDPETVAEANANPEVFAGKSIKDVADHLETIDRYTTLAARQMHEDGRRASLPGTSCDPPCPSSMSGVGWRGDGKGRRRRRPG